MSIAPWWNSGNVTLTSMGRTLKYFNHDPKTSPPQLAFMALLKPSCCSKAAAVIMVVGSKALMTLRAVDSSLRGGFSSATCGWGTYRQIKTGAGFKLKNKNGPFSAVSKPNFTSKYSLELGSIWKEDWEKGTIEKRKYDWRNVAKIHTQRTPIGKSHRSRQELSNE